MFGAPRGATVCWFRLESACIWERCSQPLTVQMEKLTSSYFLVIKADGKSQTFLSPFLLMVPEGDVWISSKPQSPDAVQLVLPPGMCPLEDIGDISSSVLSNSVLWFILVT